MDGSLHTYDTDARLVLFDSLPASTDVVVFVGGLGDGLLAVPYLGRLLDALRPLGFGLCQVLLSSSYTAWGRGSIDRDAEELRRCLVYLHRTLSKARVVLLGHSSGCQASVRFLAAYGGDDAVAGVVRGSILQAPVSDREYSMTKVSSETLEALVRVAQERVRAGLGDLPFVDPHVRTLYPDDFITAHRFVSLNAVAGDEDYFSSDLTTESLTRRLGTLRGPIVFAIGEADETMPPHIDKADLLSRFVRTCREASPTSCIVPGADHALSTDVAAAFFVDRVVTFLIDEVR